MSCAKCWIPSITDYIGFYENIIPDSVCDNIIDHDWSMRKSTYSNNESKSKTSDERVEMDEVWVMKDMPYYDDIKKGVLKTIKEYSNHHKLFSCQRHTDFRINKYSKGGFMSEHVDNIHHSHGQQYGYPQVSVLLYLNDDYEGGEFFVAKEMFLPEKGSAIIFPSNFMYPHEAKSVTKGTRWSIVSWLM